MVKRTSYLASNEMVQVRILVGPLTEQTEGLPDWRRDPVGSRSSIFKTPCEFESRSFRLENCVKQHAKAKDRTMKPAIVLREQKRKGVKHRRHRRKTAAYVRQGEWFFLPRPNMHVGELAVRNGQLVRAGGKPHRVEWLYCP
jgi:hypothetical protein